MPVDGTTMNIGGGAVDVKTAGDILQLGGIAGGIRIVPKITQPVAATKTAGSACMGTCALDTSGTVTVSTTAVTAASIVWVQMLTAGGVVGGLYRVAPADIVAGTSFIIRSFVSSTAGGVTAASSDTSTVAWWIIN